MRALDMQNALRRAVGPAISFFFLAILFFLGFKALGPRGVGLPPTKPMLDLANWIVPLLTSTLVLGFAVMAIIQLFKPEIRAAFHLRQITFWLAYWRYDRSSVHEFLRIVSPKGDDALLELPIEQLAAQIQAAADAALAIRSSRSEMFLGMVLGEEMPFKVIPDEPKDQSRIAYIIQRRLDDLQIQVKRKWRRSLRLMCVTVALLLTSFVAGVLGLWQTQMVGTAFLVLLFSLVGAFFASVARDVVAIVERLRN